MMPASPCTSQPEHEGLLHADRRGEHATGNVGEPVADDVERDEVAQRPEPHLELRADEREGRGDVEPVQRERDDAQADHGQHAPPNGAWLSGHVSPLIGSATRLRQVQNWLIDAGSLPAGPLYGHGNMGNVRLSSAWRRPIFRALAGISLRRWSTTATSTPAGFVGRQSELRILGERLAAAELGHPQVVYVEGEAGGGEVDSPVGVPRFAVERRRARGGRRRGGDAALLRDHRSAAARDLDRAGNGPDGRRCPAA